MNHFVEEAEALFDEMVAIRRSIHRQPELGMQETRTTQLILENLTSYGVAIEDYDLPVGVTGIIHGGKIGKTIALRADIDALPMQEKSGLAFTSKTDGACHSCGHDIHTTILLSCARILQRHSNKLSGNIRLLFQPAEELGTGAQMMVHKGVLTRDPKPDQILGMHVAMELPFGKIGLKKGVSSSASDQIEITVKGRGAHGAHPYRAIDPIVTTAYLITQLQTIISREISPFQSAVLSFGTIHGGSAPNIIPGEVVVSGTLRSFDNELRKQLWAAIKRTCEYHCQSMRAEALVNIVPGSAPILHNTDMIDRIANAVEKTIGKENIVMLERPTAGSEDFGVYLEHLPGARFRIGAASEPWDSNIGTHHPSVIFDERTITLATAVICQYVSDYLK